jgi:hypothetical protein
VRRATPVFFLFVSLSVIGAMVVKTQQTAFFIYINYKKKKKKKKKKKNQTAFSISLSNDLNWDQI